jgi:hypothetical protein
MSWKDELPADIKDSPALKDIPDVATLAKSLVDTQLHLGKSMKQPDPEWTPDELTAWDTKVMEKSAGRLIKAPVAGDPTQSELFYKSLGKPDAPDKYTSPEDVDLSKLDPTQIATLRNRLHKANITDAQQKVLIKDLADDYAAKAAAGETDLAANKDQLELSWGKHVAFKADALAGKLAKMAAPASLTTAITEGKLDATTTLFLDRVMNQMSGEGNPASGDPLSQGNRTPLDIKADIAGVDESIRIVMESAKTPVNQNRHRELVNKRLKLVQEQKDM